MVGAICAFEVHSASLSVLPLSQNPRQSSSPSADASGAKLVSPPLFQSRYSRLSHSVAGTSYGRFVSRVTPVGANEDSRGCGVCNGILTLQCSSVGQNELMTESLGATAWRRLGTVHPVTAAHLNLCRTSRLPQRSLPDAE